MTVLLKFTCRGNVIPIEILAGFVCVCGSRQPDPKIHMEMQGIQNSQNNL